MAIPRYSGEALGNHARLTQKKGVILYVEDASIKTAIDLYFEGNVTIQVAGNWEAVLKAVDKARANNEDKKIYGFIDRDYHPFLDSHGVIANPSIITTDNRDIEIDMMVCDAGKKLAISIGATNKAEAVTFIQSLIASLHEVSLYRVYNHEKTKRWKFSCHSIYKAWKKDVFNQRSFEAVFFKENQLKADDKKSVLKYGSSKNFASNHITRGHDLCSYFLTKVSKTAITETEYLAIRSELEDRIILAANSGKVQKLAWMQRLAEISS